MLSEDQKTRLRVLSTGAALVWIVLGLISGWPTWVWIVLAVVSVLAPTILAYVQAERVLRRSGRGARRTRRGGARRPGATDDSDDSGDDSGGTLNARESAPTTGSAPRRDTTASDHALALVASLPPSQRHRFARDLASLLDDNELRTAARAVRQERAEAVSHEDTRPLRSGTSRARSTAVGRNSGSSPGTGARSSEVSGAGSGGSSIADNADPDDVVIAGSSPENRSGMESFLDSRPRIHMPEPPAERVPARGAHDEDEDDEEDDGDGG
ncbi:hypothetical protein [Salinifilum ghardaiensis]